jgi:hypothetical protein
LFPKPGIRMMTDSIKFRSMSDGEEREGLGEEGMVGSGSVGLPGKCLDITEFMC